MSDLHEQLDIAATLEEFFQDCLANGFSCRTVQCYRSSLRPWQNFLSQKGIDSLADVTADILLQYRHHLHTLYRSSKGRPIAISTQAQKLAALRSYLSFCARIGKTLLNPVRALPKPKLPKSLPRGILSKQQIKKLLCVPDTNTPMGFRDRVILELFYCTGVRRNELTTIELNDCHFNEKRIFIRNGKGGKQRWVPLPHKVCEILREYVEVIRPALLHGKTHDYLIVAPMGGRVYGPHVYTIVKGYLKQLNINSDCHGIRHTCATHLLKGKANLRVIQTLLGHKSLASTQIYTHVEIADLVRAIAKAHPRAHMHCDQLDGE